MALPGNKRPISDVTWRLFLGAVLLTLPAAAEGQSYPLVEAGVVHAQGEYDLSGVGWAHLYSVRVPVTLNRWVVVEPGLTYFDYLTQHSQEVWYLVPEIQAQLSPREGRFRPYLGAGIGAARASFPGAEEWVLSLSAAGGLRAGVTGPWSVVGELRVHALDPWTGSVGAFGVGLLRRF